MGASAFAIWGLMKFKKADVSSAARTAKLKPAFTKASLPDLGQTRIGIRT